MENQLLTRTEVAAYMRISPRTVRRLGSAGYLDEVRIGRAIRITAASITGFIAENHVRRSGDRTGLTI